VRGSCRGVRIVPLLSCCDASSLSPTEGTTLDGRIVVGVDGSPASALALRWALDQGALTGAAVEAVNAWQVPQVPGGRISTMGVDFSAISKEILRNAVEAVGASPESVTETTVEGHPAKVLVDASDGADLLVVGNRGHGGFTGMLLGSVSGHVLAHAHCPTVIVRA
jgi:nucleotide-binding universal stress UspA family protein